MPKVRIDKWLWSVRLYKSRSRATQACQAGRVKLNDAVVKPAQKVVVGDQIKLRKRITIYEYEVLKPLNKRVGAPIAVTAYRDCTSEAEKKKDLQWYAARRSSVFRDKGLGRPTKKDRRDIDEFYEFLFEEE